MSETVTEALVETRGLSCRGPQGSSIEEVSLALKPGTAAALVAEPRPAGLLLLDCLFGLSKPAAGTVQVVGGAPVERSGAERLRVAYVRGYARFFPWAVKVKEYLRQTSLLVREPRGEDRVMEELGLGDIADAYLHTLSPESQRLTRIASSLVGSADVLLYENLFQGLSPAKSETVCNIVGRLRDAGKVIVYLADRAGLEKPVCNYVLVLANGKLSASDTPEGLLQTRAGDMRVVVRSDQDIDPDKARQLPFVRRVTKADSSCEFLLEDRPRCMHELLDFLESQGVELHDVQLTRFSVWDAVREALASAEEDDPAETGE